MVVDYSYFTTWYNLRQPRNKTVNDEWWRFWELHVVPWFSFVPHDCVRWRSHHDGMHMEETVDRFWGKLRKPNIKQLRRASKSWSSSSGCLLTSTACNTWSWSGLALVKTVMNIQVPYLFIYSFIHSVVRLTTVPSRASSLNYHLPRFSLRPSSSSLRLLPRLTVTYILPPAFPSVTCSI